VDNDIAATLPDRPAVRPDLRIEALEDELVLYDPRSGRAYVLNPTASALWERCDGSRSVETLAQELAAAFEVAYDDALADVRAFLTQLSRGGLLAA
jgi:PqqD family protein of HPr-rel-A system